MCATIDQNDICNLKYLFDNYSNKCKFVCDRAFQRWFICDSSIKTWWDGKICIFQSMSHESSNYDTKISQIFSVFYFAIFAMFISSSGRYQISHAGPLRRLAGDPPSLSRHKTYHVFSRFIINYLRVITWTYQHTLVADHLLGWLKDRYAGILQLYCASW